MMMSTFVYGASQLMLIGCVCFQASGGRSFARSARIKIDTAYNKQRLAASRLLILAAINRLEVYLLFIALYRTSLYITKHVQAKASLHCKQWMEFPLACFPQFIRKANQHSFLSPSFIQRRYDQARLSTDIWEFQSGIINHKLYNKMY